jgi:hypothetical protein
MSRPTAKILLEMNAGRSFTQAARIVGRRGGLASAQRRREAAQRQSAEESHQRAFERLRARRPDLYE